MKRLASIHPGEILREEFMRPLDISQYRLAQATGVPVTRIAAIYHEKRGITPDTAIRLGRALNTSAQFWLNLQAHYDLDILQEDHAQEYEAIHALSGETQEASSFPSA